MNAGTSSIKFRANRFRSPSLTEDILLPPPLPLIKLPDDIHQARSGVITRPTHLPVRKHIIATPESNVKVEPVLKENKISVDGDYEDDDAKAITSCIHIYEYNNFELKYDAPEDTLEFNALYEGGNLMRAYRISREETGRKKNGFQEYELLIHPDIKNSAYRQWFYFEVKNGQPGVEYKFRITNLAKSGALFGNGLQPVVYSEINATSKNIGWVHQGSNIRYDVSTSTNSPPGSNTLSFHYRFEHPNDIVYFACLQPYTYTDLMDYLDKLEADPERAATFRRAELCQTLAQNSCEILSVTSPNKDGIPHDERRIIVLSARVHPGEPNSSWMMKGMIDFLTGPSSGAMVLRNTFIFKIVPMLNPDGVINGNTRVNLAGWDLNRKWSYPAEKLFPTVFHLKKHIATFQARDRVAIYCDLHGHSINRNIFTYGCYSRKTKKSASAQAAAVAASAAVVTAGGPTKRNVKSDPRVFPMIVAKNSDFFSFKSCDFKVQKSKLNTARVVVNHELGVINSYTLEASFCGPDFGARKDTQFSTIDLEEMGKSWCKSLLIYFGLLPQVRRLDKKRKEESKNQQLHNIISTEDLILSNEFTTDILSDCEAAVSEMDFEMMDECENLVDSDLSDAEDPIPPTQGPEEETLDRAFPSDSQRSDRDLATMTKELLHISKDIDPTTNRETVDKQINKAEIEENYAEMDDEEEGIVEEAEEGQDEVEEDINSFYNPPDQFPNATENDENDDHVSVSFNVFRTVQDDARSSCVDIRSVRGRSKCSRRRSPKRSKQKKKTKSKHHGIGDTVKGRKLRSSSKVIVSPLKNDMIKAVAPKKRSNASGSASAAVFALRMSPANSSTLPSMSMNTRRRRLMTAPSNANIQTEKDAGEERTRNITTFSSNTGSSTNKMKPAKPGLSRVGVELPSMVQPSMPLSKLHGRPLDLLKKRGLDPLDGPFFEGWSKLETGANY